MQVLIDLPVGTVRILAERADFHSLSFTKFIEQEVIRLSMLKVSGHSYRKDHCPQGHEYTPENCYISVSKKGYRKRLCRQCRREKNLARYYENSRVMARDPSKGRKKYDSTGARIRD